MQALPRAARWYLYMIWVAALLVGSYAFWQNSAPPPHPLLLFAMLAAFVLADYFYVLFKVNKDQQVGMTVVDALTIFLVSTTGIYGILVTSVGSLSSDLLARRQWFKGIFNAAQRSLSYLALVTIYNALSQPGQPPFSGLSGLLAFLAIAVVYHGLNTLFVAVIVALVSRQPLPKIYVASYRQVHWVHFITLPFGAILAHLWAVNPWLLVPAAIPLLMAQRSFRAMAELQKQSERNEELAHQSTSLLEELRTKQAELVRTSQLAALGTFSAGIAHEFNNLLAAILGYAQLALTTDDPREKDDALDVAIRACLRGRSITSGLLTFARRRDPQWERCSLDVLIEETVTLMRPEFAKQQVQITQHLSPVPTIMCDAGQIAQVLINLLTNARDAMAPHGGEIEVLLQERGGAVELAVRDHGSGIPQELLPQIFQPFMTTKGALGGSTTPGTGLGLAISHGIVESHGGTIGVESVVGQGTTMTVQLPLPAQATQERREDCDHNALPPMRILVVDDEDVIADWLYQSLVRDHHQVVVAYDATSGLQRFSERPFDLVICDVTLPGMGGDELTRRIRALHPTAQILGMTGQPGSLQADRMLALGALSVLSKPFTYDDLRRTLQRALSEQHA
jgi:signal transduction histidine kinase/CheY-like chemotaxis protein